MPVPTGGEQEAAGHTVESGPLRAGDRQRISSGAGRHPPMATQEGE